VLGPLDTFDKELPKAAPSKHPAAVQSSELSALVLTSDYCKERVGFVPSDATDFSDLKPVEVEEVDEGTPEGARSDGPGREGGTAATGSKDTAALEELYVTEHEETCKSQRAQMRSEGKWFHDDGQEVEWTRHLAVSIHTKAFDFSSPWSESSALRPAFPTTSWSSTCSTATRASLSSCEPHMALWLINQIYWSDAASRARWYLRGARVEPCG